MITSSASLMEASALLTQEPPWDEFLDLSADVQDLLRCATCRGRLLRDSSELVCANPDCGERFPVVDKIPVLINDEKSLFTREDFVARRNTTSDLSRPWLKRWLDQLLPTLGSNLSSKQNYRLLAKLLLARSPRPVVLVVGGGILGQGLQELVSRPEIRLVETDVSFAPRTKLICDAHDLPFEAHSFDGVVVQAVLQYVSDPIKCVKEIERVLKPRALVYAETAFMQQVVHGRYDFTRFTHLGVVRLFRSFRMLRSGPTGGPGMALAWACHFFLLSFVSGRFSRSVIHAIARLTLFWLKYFDKLLANKPGTYDSASGFFFLGARSGRVLSDRETVMMYRGAESCEC